MSKNLTAVRVNHSYIREADENGDMKYVRVAELVIIGDQAKYTRSNGGDIIRERELTCDKFRLRASEWPKLKDLIDRLMEADETELG